MLLPVAAVLVVIWLATGVGYFWPVWPLLGFAIAAGLERSKRLEHVLLVGAVVVVAVWGLSGLGYFWPVWPLLGFAIVAGVDRMRRREDPEQVERLEGRVSELTRTRQGALEVQGEELRRIERDLHDGAQSRLVALAMLVGRAEARLADRPEEAALLRRAREEATGAIKELRDLSRGIAPPVLADRGLQAAVEAVAERAPAPVAVAGEVPGRLGAAVETAAYFVVTEALTNVAKHAPGASARVELARVDDLLVVEVADEGPGGADPQGGGLAGLRRRVEALDGRLMVVSRDGVGTTVRAEIPCGS